MATLSEVPALNCANLTCPNRMNEGKFMLLDTIEPVVGGHRSLRLLLCAPCGQALIRMTKKESQ